MFPCEFCEIFRNTFFTEHLWTTASVECVTLNAILQTMSFLWIASILQFVNVSVHIRQENSRHTIRILSIHAEMRNKKVSVLLFGQILV